MAQTDLYTKLETNADLLIKASVAVILGLMLILSVYSTVESFGQETKDKAKEERKETKDKAKEERKETKDKAKEETGHADNIEQYVNELQHRADRLQKTAEEQDNREALAVIQQAIDLIGQIRQMVSEKNYDGAKPLLRDANDMLNKAARMLKGDSDASGVPEQDYTSMIEKFVSDLEHRADRLQKTAEEQNNNEALAVIQQAIDLINQAKQVMSEQNYERAKILLREANDLLNKAGMMLNGGSNINPPPDVNYADNIEKFVGDLEQRASRLQKAAEDQGNNEALAIIQQATDLIVKAKEMISQDNFDGAKPLLRDANDLLNKAGMMLNGGSYANPVPGNEGQAPYYPSQPPANGNRPNMHPMFSLVGVGTATEGGEGETAEVFAELELSVFRATRNMMLLRVTEGIITVDDAIYTVEQGKAIMAMKAHKMILIAKVSSDDTAERLALKLFGSMPNLPSNNMDNPQPDNMNNPPPSMPTITLRGKLAQMLINIDVEVT